MPAFDAVQFGMGALVGAAGGIFSGMFGVGGGIVSVPLARYWLGISAHVAIGSTLAVILPTACVGAYSYSRQGKIVWRLAMASGCSAALGSICGAFLGGRMAGAELMLLLSLIMFLVGIDLLAGFSVKAKQQPEPPESTFQFNMKSASIAAVGGLLIGGLAGMVGIGGGFLLVPLYCYVFGLQVKTAFGTSLVVVALVALPGTAVHLLQGHVDPVLVLSLLTGSLPGVRLGSQLALKTKESVLRMIFGIILFGTASFLVWREIARH